MVTHGCNRAFSLVLLHGLLSGPSVQGGTFHGALCRRFSRTAGGCKSYILSGHLSILLYATAATTAAAAAATTTAAAAAAHWVTVALLTVPAGLWALQDACRCLLLCLIHVTSLVLGAAWHLPLSLLSFLTGACTHLGLGAACWFCREKKKEVYYTSQNMFCTMF